MKTPTHRPPLKTMALGLLLLAAGAASAATGSGSATADIDMRDYTLAVASAHGSPVPAVGTNTYAWRAAVTASVEAAVSEGVTNYTCTGWTGAGSIPTTGATNTTGAITLTNVASSLAWRWQVSAVTHTVTLHPGAHGTIAGANDGSNYVTTVTNGLAFPAVTVNANAGWTFAGWNPSAPATVTNDFEATAVWMANVPHYEDGSWTLISNALNYARGAPGFVKLRDGRVLVEGGTQSADPAEVFNPATDTWSLTSPMYNGRSAGTPAVLLDDGSVVVAGRGDGPYPGPYSGMGTSETFDPATLTWTASGNLPNEAMFAGATRFADGRVILVGHRCYPMCYNTPWTRLYNPTSRTWSAAADMVQARQGVSPVLLNDGRILVCGGPNIPSACDQAGSLSSAETFNPASMTWQAVGSMSVPRFQHAVTKLADGRILVTGGEGGLTTCEIFEPDTNTWTPTANMSQGRTSHGAVLLPDGRVVVIGGCDSAGVPLRSVEIYDPLTEAWSSLPPLHEPRGIFPVAVLLDDGRLLVAGGYNGSLSLQSMELLIPASPPPTHTITLHPGSHGTIAGTNPGSNYVTTVTNGAAFPAVMVVTNAGWTFTGWNPPAPPTVTNDFEATATYAADSMIAIPIAEFEVNGGATYVRDSGDYYLKVLAARGGGVRMDENGAVHLAYGNSNTIRHAVCGADGRVTNSLVDIVSKRQVMPSLARNETGIYLATMEWDRRSTYSSYWDGRLYRRPNGGSWTKLQDIYLDVYSEDGGGKDLMYSIKEDPNGNMHLLYWHDGWWTYGSVHQERIMDKNTHVLGNLNMIAGRTSGSADMNRNAEFNGCFYLTASNTLVMPCIDHESQMVFLSESVPATHDQWTDKGNRISSMGYASCGSLCQDADGNVHALIVSCTTGRAYYSLNWGTPVQVCDLPAYPTGDITVFGGRIYVLLSYLDPIRGYAQGNLYLVSKPLAGTEWSVPQQVTFETKHLNNWFAGDYYFARPFGYRQEPSRLCFAYVAYDGTVSGNDNLNNHIRVVQLADIARAVTLHSGAHGTVAGVNLGSNYVGTVANGLAFPAVTVNANAGWVFAGWNPPAPATVTNDFEATATYVLGPAAALPTTIGNFKVDVGVTFFRDDWQLMRVLAYSGGGIRVDESGKIHLAYGDYNQVRYAVIDKAGIVSNELVGVVSKKNIEASLTRNTNGLYLVTSEWDRLSQWGESFGSRLYQRPAGGNWTKLHDLYEDLPAAEGGPQDLVYSIEADPNGDLHLLYFNCGWYSYGGSHKERLMSAETSALGNLTTIAGRSGGNPDTTRNASFFGSFYTGNDNALIMPFSDYQDWAVFTSQAPATNYGAWAAGANLVATGGRRWSGGMFQDANGDVHAISADIDSLRACYSCNWQAPVPISDTLTVSPDIDVTVFRGRIYALMVQRDPAHANASGNVFLASKPLTGGSWSTPVQVTFETNYYNNALIEQCRFARPFGYRVEPERLAFAYEVYDGVLSGNDYLGAHIRVVALSDGTDQPATHTVTLHPGAHGTVAGANSGSNYVVTVTNGLAFPAVTVNADAGWTFTGWNPPAPATVTNDFDATAQYAVVTCTLTVASAHGTPVPGSGTHSYLWSTEVACQSPGIETVGPTQFVCTGWTGAGSVPAEGTSTSASFTITSDSSIAWQWATNYWVAFATNGAGAVSLSNGWQRAGSTQSVTTLPAYGWLFTGWSGDLAGDRWATNTVLTVTAPKTATAHFSDDPDGDGLINVVEWAIGSDPWNPDSNGDGFDDGFAYRQGFSVTNANTAILDYIVAHSNRFGLYGLDGVAVLVPGSLWIEATNGSVSLQLQPEQSLDLTTWTNAGAAVKWTLPAPGSQRLYRIRATK